MLTQQLSLKPKLIGVEKNVAISANNLDMVFKSGPFSFPVLKHIDLTVNKGYIQLLMGPSGSGKTTLLSILAGLMTPTAGTVHLLGQDITKMNPKQLAEFRLRHLGFIFQGFNLFPALTASENVEVALNIKGIRGRCAKNQSLSLLKSVGLADKIDFLPRNLSGGQKQRVAVARALAGSPEIIMADEPTAALDSQSGHQIIELLYHLAKAKNSTVLIVTHDPRIKDVADKVLYLEDGLIKSRS
jgi:putative ABC transport system ATP-binding protein